MLMVVIVKLDKKFFQVDKNISSIRNEWQLRRAHTQVK